MTSLLSDRIHPTWALVLTACEKNDTVLLAQTLSTVSDERELEHLPVSGLRDAIQNNSVDAIVQLIERGANVNLCVTLRDITAIGAEKRPSKATLELLLAHSWDINTRHDSLIRKGPFIWHHIDDVDMISPCLEHGADEKDIEDPLVRKLENSEEHKKRIVIVLHLLNVIGLDVNAPDEPPHSRKPWQKGTPICYFPGLAVYDTNTRELTWLLPDQGADPTPALTTFNISYTPKFVQNVEEWKAQRDRGGRNGRVM